MPEVAAVETALVREGAHDLPGLDALAAADLDPVGGESAVRRALPTLGALTAVAIEAVAPVTAFGTGVAVVALAAGETGVVRREEERLVALGDDRQRRRDVGLDHVVMLDVVADDVAEALQALGVGERRGDGVVEA
ncbi:hypothetical protein ACH61_03120 [Rathayibacter tanaceti]|uniref:Uncharacterized protein n=1 Tax=Rathayibacter tanaceti TaxID=1671680 RepID=A0A162FUQ4_9MICO|nr:hypothetical protein ACH61_03120 [Rathayibacter tanaceti]